MVKKPPEQGGCDLRRRATQRQLHHEYPRQRGKVKVLVTTPWSIACQAPLSMELSRLEYWSGLPCPPAGKDPPQNDEL